MANGPVSPYSWLIAPGDSIQPDYSTPTRVKLWMQTTDDSLPPSTDPEKQIVYGQWIAQLLDCQLGTNLVALYHDQNISEAPFTLSGDAITELGTYFTNNGPQQT